MTDTKITTTRTNRTIDRAIQNSKAIFTCIKSSIKCDIKDTIFTQFGNIPTHTDGITLFKKLTTLTTVSSLQLSMISFQYTLGFSTFDHGFNIPAINSKLMHLFDLAKTHHCVFVDCEHIQHILHIYTKIL